MYASPSDIRRHLRLPSTYPTDDIIEFIKEAQKVVLHQITDLSQWEKVEALNASRTEYQLAHYPVADRNFDFEIDTEDIDVYVVPYDEDIGEWDKTQASSITITNFKPSLGRFSISFEPTDDQRIYATYRYYLNPNVDNDLVKLATEKYACYLILRAIYALMPETMTIGSLKIAHKRPYESYYREYQDIITKLKPAIEITSSPKIEIEELEDNVFEW